MKYERPYKVKGEIKPGYACAQDSDENSVVLANGTNDYLGPYEFENQRLEKKESNNDNLSIVLTGVAKVIAGATVRAGKRAIINSAGKYVELPTNPGTYKTAGLFLEGGNADEYVDLFVERGTVVIS
jgi:hypothetical protein